MPQSQNTDQPTEPRGYNTERIHPQDSNYAIIVKKQLSRPRLTEIIMEAIWSGGT